MVAFAHLIHHGITIGAMSRTSALMGAVTVAVISLLALPSRSTSEAEPLSNTYRVPALGVTLRYPDGWSIAPERFTNMYELINVPADQQATAAASIRLKIIWETRIDPTEAIRRLGEIADEASTPTFLDISGWPALQRRHLGPRPQPSQGPVFADEMAMRASTAVAVGNLLIRLEADLPSDAEPDLIALVEAIGRSLVFETTGDPGTVEQELQSLRSRPGPEGLLFTPVPGIQGPAEEIAPGVNQRIFAAGFGEIEIAVSTNGQNVVIGRQSAFATSNDGGQTFPFSGFIPFGNGDPSVAFGQSGNFYYAGIDFGGLNLCPANSDCTGIARSTDNGQTFPIIANAVVCPRTGPAACFPDQEHIAADRFNAAPAGDQVYSTWRNFDLTDQDPGLVCSQDSGVSWTAPLVVDFGFFPRITVGQDGYVYVAYLAFPASYLLHKFSSCATGLTPQPGFPVTVLARRRPAFCPFPGHDRCDQNPSSQTVAVDDLDPNHVYYAYADNTVRGAAPARNDDVRVQDSLDGGLTWPAARAVTVNAPVPGARIMPWVCTTGGEAVVTWYDRRNATAANNDATDYFGGRARLDGMGNLVAIGDFTINEVSDPWCGDGSANSWPCGTRNPGASESCSLQPQLAGFCCAAGNCSFASSFQRCDFSDGGCPAGELCSIGNGCPKYGDYNGNACAAGRLFAGWASATSPPSIQPPSTAIGVFFDSFSFRVTIDIDIKPSTLPNSIKLTERGVIPVAILTTPTFDASAVDVATVCFGDAEDAQQRDCTESHGIGHLKDVDGDTDRDLVLHYETRETGIDAGDTEACLDGMPFGGPVFEGCDSVRPIP